MQTRRNKPRAKLVVVIDDDRLTLEAMDGLLRGWRYQVVTAQSDNEALERLGGRRPDLIISDYRLAEGRTGLQAIDRLRQTFEIPAMVITGSTVPSDQLGRHRVLRKPLRPAELKDALDRICSSDDQAREPDRSH